MSDDPEKDITHTVLGLESARPPVPVVISYGCHGAEAEEEQILNWEVLLCVSEVAKLHDTAVHELVKLIVSCCLRPWIDLI